MDLLKFKEQTGKELRRHIARSQMDLLKFKDRSGKEELKRHIAR